MSPFACIRSPDSADRRRVVARLGGADEVVVRAVEHLHHGLEARHVAVGEFARRQALLGRGLHHLDAVLVGAGEEEHVVAVEPHEAGDGVGGDHLIGVADVRLAVGIGDRGGDVIRLALETPSRVAARSVDEILCAQAVSAAVPSARSSFSRRSCARHRPCRAPSSSARFSCARPPSEEPCGAPFAWSPFGGVQPFWSRFSPSIRSCCRSSARISSFAKAAALFCRSRSSV